MSWTYEEVIEGRLQPETLQLNIMLLQSHERKQSCTTSMAHGNLSSQVLKTQHKVVAVQLNEVEITCRFIEKQEYVKRR